MNKSPQATIYAVDKTWGETSLYIVHDKVAQPVCRQIGQHLAKRVFPPHPAPTPRSLSQSYTGKRWNDFLQVNLFGIIFNSKKKTIINNPSVNVHQWGTRKSVGQYTAGRKRYRCDVGFQDVMSSGEVSRAVRVAGQHLCQKESVKYT